MVATVLIIDDNQDHRVLIDRVISRIELDTVIAENIKDVMNFLDRADIVVLDMNLSDKWSMNSFEIIDYIRNHTLFSALPILALATRIAHEKNDAYMWDILMMKPFNVHQFQYHIRQLMNN